MKGLQSKEIKNLASKGSEDTTTTSYISTESVTIMAADKKDVPKTIVMKDS